MKRWLLCAPLLFAPATAADAPVLTLALNASTELLLGAPTTPPCGAALYRVTKPGQPDMLAARASYLPQGPTIIVYPVATTRIFCDGFEP